jgi:putative chitinase
MSITNNQLKRMLPNNPNYAEWLDLINRYTKQYNINTRYRIACFIGQLSHESMEFRVLQENLNYSARGLRTVFGKYFPNQTIANIYARQPIKIASRVYANRMGNGSESSMDGWKYRGRGLIMITGKENYIRFANHIGKSLESTIDYMETQEGAIQSACWFWETQSLNRYCDTMSVQTLTVKINGGMNGYADRLSKIRKNLTIL